MAAGNGHLEVVEILLAHGANANLANQSGSTPLHWAALNGHTRVAEALLALAAIDVTLRDGKGQTAFTVAIAAGHEDLGTRILAKMPEEPTGLGGGGEPEEGEAGPGDEAADAGAAAGGEASETLAASEVPLEEDGPILSAADCERLAAEQDAAAAGRS